MFRILVKSGEVKVEGREFPVRYFRMRTTGGSQRFSAEICLDVGDTVIRDDDSIESLEVWMARLLPFLLFSRNLAV